MRCSASRAVTIGMAVVNDYAPALSFLADKARTRRDHLKYLTLIEAIALLHKHQSEVENMPGEDGQPIAFIRVTKDDIQLANQIEHEVLGRTLDELPPQTRKLLRLIGEMVEERAKALAIAANQVRFTRRDVREATGWSDSQLKLHCARLAEMEYLLIHGGCRGHALSYELLWDGQGDEDERRLCGLLDPEHLPELPLRPAQVWAREAQVGAKSAPSLGQVDPKSGVVDATPGRAGAGAATDSSLNGAKTHIEDEDVSSLTAVVTADSE